jgi:hypothetical protein
MTLRAAAKAPSWCASHLEVFEGHLFGGAPNPFARIVNEDINRSEIGFDRSEDPFHRGRIAHIASIALA